MRHHRRAFTLVELLVVIGIIVVLVAMLLPALKKARDESIFIACRSNLRQVYIGCVAYQQDYGKWPEQRASFDPYFPGGSEGSLSGQCIWWSATTGWFNYWMAVNNYLPLSASCCTVDWDIPFPNGYAAENNSASVPYSWNDGGEMLKIYQGMGSTIVNTNVTTTNGFDTANSVFTNYALPAYSYSSWGEYRHFQYAYWGPRPVGIKRTAISGSYAGDDEYWFNAIWNNALTGIWFSPAMTNILNTNFPTVLSSHLPNAHSWPQFPFQGHRYMLASCPFIRSNIPPSGGYPLVTLTGHFNRPLGVSNGSVPTAPTGYEAENVLYTDGSAEGIYK